MREVDRYQIHCRVLSGLRAVVEARKLDFDALLKSVGLFPEPEPRLDCFMPMERFGELLERLAALTRDDLIGAAVGASYDPRTLGPWAYAVMSAPNPKASLDVLVRYVRAYADVPFISLTFEAGVARFSWAYPDLVIHRHQMADRAVVMLVRQMRMMIGGDFQPLGIYLERPQPHNPRLHMDLMGANVHYDQRVTAIVFKASHLERPNPRADERIYEMSLALAERLIAERRFPDDLLTRVMEDIMRSLNMPGPMIAETARRLSMTTRSLQRRLSERGYSYNDLVDDARKRTTEALLKTTNLPISEIAHRVGFSNQGNLTRAVRRWFDETPRAIRKNGFDEAFSLENN